MNEKKKKKQQGMTDEEFEAMRQRALRPFKPSITDEEIRNFEENIRKQSLENARKQKESLNAYDKEKIKERTSFEYYL